MDKELWTTVDRYICDHFLPPDSALEQAQATSAKAALPDIAVSPNHGKLLYLLAKILGAKRILELGFGPSRKGGAGRRLDSVTRRISPTHPALSTR